MSTFPADRPIKTKPSDVDDDVIRHKLDDPRATFAESLSFETYEDLLSSSTEAASNDGERWFVTQLQDGSFAAWTEKSMDVDRHFATREEALASVPHESETAGKVC